MSLFISINAQRGAGFEGYKMQYSHFFSKVIYIFLKENNK